MNIFDALEAIETTIPEDEIEVQVINHTDNVRALVIVDQRTYDIAAEVLIANKLLQAKAIDHHAEAKKKTYDAWQSVIAMERKILDPLKEAEVILKAAVAKWTQEQKRIQAERDAAAQALADAERAKEIAQEVKEAQESGAPAEIVKAIAEAPRPTPRPVMAPTYQKSKALPTTPTYSCEVFDVKALCRAVASDVASVELVMGLERDKLTGFITSPALEKLASALRETFNVAGCRLIQGTRVSTRTKGRASS